MFPIRDHNPSGRTPYVTWALIAINIAIYLAMLPIGDQPAAVNAIYTNYGLVPGRMQAPDFLTTMFLHGGFMHLAGNMLFLWIFGDNLEDEMGHIGFLVFYLASGVCASLAHVLSAPGSEVALIGASGAIAGVMGGYLLLFPRARIDVLLIIIIFFRIFPVRAWAVLLVWFGLQLVSGVSTPSGGGGVAYWAHAGGFVIGVVLTLPLWLRLGGPQFWMRNAGHPPHPEAVYQRSHVPTVTRTKSSVARVPRVRRPRR